jgi:hypothetical protein
VPIIISITTFALKIKAMVPLIVKPAGRIPSLRWLILLIASAICVSASSGKKSGNADTFIANGQMPNITTDKTKNIHLVFGNKDSILYSVSSDLGASFSKPTLVAVVPGLAASHTRGPQIAATSTGVIITAGNEQGNIFSFFKSYSGTWTKGARVNDRDTTAKENLMALAADGQYAFAVWLDLRNDKHNKIFGAKTTDNGKTWSKNILIYASPDKTVCECCKPSVAIDGNNVYVMFRNWINGNRDLYLIQSTNGGRTFGEAKKLGKESWALNGCPMDGGGISISNGIPQTVWNSKGTIYAYQPNGKEQKLGEGRSCTMASINGKNIYAWVEKGDIIALTPNGLKKNLGKGQLPLIKTIDNGHAICIWENEKQIHKSIIDL